jgi:hypothetical protein
MSSTMENNNTDIFATYSEKKIYLSLAKNYSTNCISANTETEAQQQLIGCFQENKDFESAIEPLKLLLTKEGLVKFRTQYRHFPN